METKNEGGNNLFLWSSCEGLQKHLLSVTGFRENVEVQGVTQCPLSGGNDCCLHSSYTKYILITEAKVCLTRMHHAVFMYIVFHISVKNRLSSAADSLGNFEMCPSNQISYHTLDSKPQHLSKVVTQKASRQALRSTLFQNEFLVSSKVVISKN